MPLPKAQLLLLSLLTPGLLPLGFVGARAFPAIRLPLLVQAADADTLPPADRDVLLHEAREHACRERQTDTAALERRYCPCGGQPSLSRPEPSSRLLLGLQDQETGDVRLPDRALPRAPGLAEAGNRAG